jgi:hypothetical protein
LLKLRESEAWRYFIHTRVPCRTALHESSISALMQKVTKEIKKIRQLADQPAGPTRTSPFFQACAHGVNQLAQTFSFASNAN